MMTMPQALEELTLRPDPACRSKDEPSHELKTCACCNRFHDLITAIRRMPRLAVWELEMLSFRFACPLDSSVSTVFYVDPGAEPDRVECFCEASPELHEEAILRWRPPLPPIPIPKCPDFGPGHDSQACPTCIMSRRRASRVAQEQDEADAGWDIIDLGEVDVDASPDLPTIGEVEPGICLFHPGRCHILHGESGCGKSWIAYITIAQELRKGHWALVIDHEMNERDVARWLSQLGCSNDDRARVVYVQPDTIMARSDRDQLLRRFEGRHPSVVLIDSVGEDMAQAGLNSYNDNDTAAWFNSGPYWFRRVFPDSAIVLIDHLPKGVQDNQALFPIGSQRKRAAVEVNYWVKPVQPFSRQEAGYSLIVAAKDRTGNYTKKQLVARLDGGPDRITLGPLRHGDDMTSGSMEDRISDFLAANPDRTRDEVLKRVRGRRDDGLKAIKAMLTAGRLVSVATSATGTALLRLPEALEVEILV